MNLNGIIQNWIERLMSFSFRHSFVGNFLMTAEKNSNEINRCIINMSNNPCDATVSEYLDAVNRIKLKAAKPTQYERNIGRVWEKVNISPNVSSPMKEQLLDYLLFSGKVYIDNPVIIDNYAGVGNV